MARLFASVLRFFYLSFRCPRRFILLWIALIFLLAFASTAKADVYAIEIGTFKPQSAQKFTIFLNESGFPVILDSVTSISLGKMKRLYVGPYSRRQDAMRALERLQKIDISGNVSRYTPEPGLLPSQAPALSVGDEDVLEPSSLDDLFGLDDMEDQRSVLLTGFFQSELAYTTPEPGHFSKFRNILELGLRGSSGSRMKWKVSGRLEYDAVFDINDFYPENVKEDQQVQLDFRETYLDVSLGNGDFRFGRQHIVWGEVVGIFVADVVSAKDFREPSRSDLDMIRIPQWAARFEYFHNDSHFDLVWIPYMTYDNIGLPGGEFYLEPSPPAGFDIFIADELRPDDTLENSAYGLRYQYLGGGWDASIFYYSSMDVSPSFERNITLNPSPTVSLRPVHGRIEQLGSTFAMDLGFSIFKLEAVYTHDRLYSVSDLSNPDGLVPQDEVEYVTSLEFSFPKRTRLNFQYFGRRVFDPDHDLLAEDVTKGVSMLFSTRVLGPKIEAQLLYFHGLNNEGWTSEPRLTWLFKPNWHLSMGANLFGVPETSLNGLYDDKDRVFTELRYSF